MNTRRRRSWLALLLVGVLLVTAGAPLVTADLGTSGQSGTHDPGRVADQVSAQQATPTPTNNSTRHENPDEAGEDGDQSALERHLARKLAQRLGQSSLQISQGEYERARSILGDDYNSQLDKYVDVAGETETADSFERAQEDQREYAKTVQSYNETYQEYQNARENGNQTRARDLARELQRTHEQVVALNDSLTGSYDSIENGTDTNLTEPKQNIETTTQNVTERHQSVVDQFEATELTVSADSETASFTDPATLSGRLVTENGTPVADRTITLVVGQDRVQTTTDGEGRFSVDYRPVVSRANASTLDVRYVPDQTSVYLNSSATVPLTVEQTTANVTISDASDSVAFGEEVSVSGRIEADGQAVGSVPVVIRVGDVTLGTVRTDSDGRFTLTRPFPAMVPAGTQSVTADVGIDGRAITGDPESAQVQVQETETTLSIEGTQNQPGSVTVSGRLATSDGEPAPNQSIDLRVGGTTVASVTTNAQGRFRTTLDLPAGATDQVRVTAVYDDPASNLASSRASTGVALSAQQTPIGPGNQQGLLDDIEQRLPDPITVELLVGAMLLISALLGIVALTRWRDTGSGTPVQASTDEVDESTSVDRSVQLLEAARRHAEAHGDRDAITTAYAAARRAAGSSLHIGSAGTHWEFYGQVRDRGSAELADRFQRLTESYEATQYGGVVPGSDRLHDLLEDAGFVVERTGDEE